MSKAIVLTIFAAASLHGAFPAIGKNFERLHPGTHVRFSFNGSQILETQLAQGAPGDVFVSADARWMKRAVDGGIVDQPTVFAHNTLAVITAPNSAIHSLGDLVRPNLRLVMCAQAVPCGAYARSVLTKIDASHHFAAGFAAAVERNVVSEEENVEAVVLKITLNEADAGFVYSSDAAAARHSQVGVISIPARYQTIASYPAAVVRASSRRAEAWDFVRYLHSAAARRELRRYGFQPTP